MYTQLLKYVSSFLKVKKWTTFTTHTSLNKTSRRDGVEKLFCEPFAQIPCSFTRGAQATLMAVSLPNWYEIELDPEEARILDAIRERLQTHLTVMVEDRALVYLAIVSDRMAVAMMFLTYVQYWAHQNKKPRVTFEDVKTHIFPNGFPDEESLRAIWYIQKVSHTDSDNLIDHLSALRSIQLP